MQGEYIGHTIFKHRYIGMDEDAIRQEIDRLQKEVADLEQMLEYYRHDNVEVRKNISESQERTEKLLKSLDTRVQNVQDAFEYTKPMKSQMDSLLKEFEVKLESLYNHEGIKKQQRNVSILTTLTVINTILIVCTIGLIGYTILFL